MKVFWAILLGSFLIASAIVFSSATDGEPRSVATGAGDIPAPAPQEQDQPPAIAETDADPEESAPSIDEPVASADAPESLEEPDQALAETIEDAGEEISEPLNLDELLGIEQEFGQVTPEMAISDSAIEVEGGRSLSQMRTVEFAELAMQASDSVEEASRVAGSIRPDDEVRADEDALVIGRVTIPGSGTEMDPYELPWGVLISAIRTYNPRLELNDLPPWAEALSGRHVRLTGFAFLPVVASETDEILLMLNPWDGCHMGAPPTPYDSVEVLLDQPVNMGGRNGFVTVSGRFNVDPYLIRGWLVSLYTMDDARLEFAGS